MTFIQITSKIDLAQLIELMMLNEQAGGERLEALFALSQVRRVALPTLMEQFGIKPLPIHAQSLFMSMLKIISTR